MREAKTTIRNFSIGIIFLSQKCFFPLHRRERVGVRVNLKSVLSPSPSSPPARGGEVLGSFSNVKRKFSNPNMKS
jgi:hypothetical protein